MYFLVLFILSLIIFVHELGHFLTAKAVGIQPKTFAIGFGKSLWKKEKGGVLYSLNALPLGGYVGFDMEKFATEPHYKRLAILAGGILFNLVFTFIPAALFVLIARYPLAYTAYQTPPKIEWGAQAFLVYTWQSVTNTFEIIIAGFGALFVSPDISQLMGPIRIITEGASLLGENILFFLPLLIIINVNVLLVNALPLPALDGGRIAFTIIEWIIKRRIPHAEKIHFAGFVALMTLIVGVIANDVYMVLVL